MSESSLARLGKTVRMYQSGACVACIVKFDLD